jgi:hypothetical protein
VNLRSGSLPRRAERPVRAGDRHGGSHRGGIIPSCMPSCTVPLLSYCSRGGQRAEVGLWKREQSRTRRRNLEPSERRGVADRRSRERGRWRCWPIYMMAAGCPACRAGDSAGSPRSLGHRGPAGGDIGSPGGRDSRPPAASPSDPASAARPAGQCLTFDPRVSSKMLPPAGLSRAPRPAGLH